MRVGKHAVLSCQKSRRARKGGGANSFNSSLPHGVWRPGQATDHSPMKSVSGAKSASHANSKRIKLPGGREDKSSLGKER